LVGEHDNGQTLDRILTIIFFTPLINSINSSEDEEEEVEASS
jgi:hypothetical protein